MKSTKNKLLSSIATLCVCFAMLIGSTYAWFTDTASTGVNKIQAGNLDIEVEYKKTDGTWASIQDATTLFSSNLWEPGHTEFVTLKVSNKGTLALKYKVMVTPVTESGGINVNNENFKLSDYLVFKTTDPITSEPSYTRDTARVAAGTSYGLADVNLLTKENTMVKGAADEYITLVVYMPETVGNAANYKTGTTAPTIELGIKVVATQVENEKDSFNNEYDANAVRDSFYTVGSYYDYYPQVYQTAAVVAGGNTVITASGKLNTTDTTNTTLAKVTVPSNAVADDVTSLTVTVNPTKATNSTALNIIQTEKDNGRETANFDIKVNGIKDGNTEDITVEVFVGKGLSSVKAYHNGTVISGATYDPNTGMVSFSTKSFSDFTVSYDPAMAAIGATTYGTLEYAVSAAKANDTVVLLKDVSLSNALKVNQTMTLDLNGFTVSAAKTAIINNGNLTLKNGSIKSTSHVAVAVGNNSVTTFESGTYTGQEGAVITGTATNATVTINGGTFNAIDNAVIAGNGSRREGESNNITVNNGTFNGGIVTSGYVACGIYAPWNDIISVNGGTFNITGGAGIVARAGNVNISGGTFNTTGNTTGKVGDSRIVVPCAALVFDSEAKYPALSDDSKINVIGGVFKSEEKVIATIGSSKRITVTGGTFSSDPSEYLTDDYQAINKENVYEIKAYEYWSNSAAQNYATPVNEIDKVVTISSAEELALFANEVNESKKNYTGYTVNLTSDIDLAGKRWTPIGQTGATQFAGTFDGKGYTINNLNINTNDKVDDNYATGLFGWVETSASILNLNIENAAVYGHHYVGTIAGYMSSTAKIQSCKVENTTVTATTIQKTDGSYDNGDKVGGIVGYINENEIKQCSISNTTVTGYRDIGGIVGYAVKSSKVTNNTVGVNVSLKCDSSHNYKNYTDNSQYDLGDIIGEHHDTSVEIDNTNTGTVTKVY